MRAFIWGAAGGLIGCVAGIFEQTFLVDYWVAHGPGRYLVGYLPAVGLLMAVAVDGLRAPRVRTAALLVLGGVLLTANVACLEAIAAFFRAHPPL